MSGSEHSNSPSPRYCPTPHQMSHPVPVASPPPTTQQMMHHSGHNQQPPHPGHQANLSGHQSPLSGHQASPLSGHQSPLSGHQAAALSGHQASALSGHQASALSSHQAPLSGHPAHQAPLSGHPASSHPAHQAPLSGHQAPPHSAHQAPPHSGHQATHSGHPASPHSGHHLQAQAQAQQMSYYGYHHQQQQQQQAQPPQYYGTQSASTGYYPVHHHHAPHPQNGYGGGWQGHHGGYYHYSQPGPTGGYAPTHPPTHPHPPQPHLPPAPIPQQPQQQQQQQQQQQRPGNINNFERSTGGGSNNNNSNSNNNNSGASLPQQPSNVQRNQQVEHVSPSCESSGQHALMNLSRFVNQNQQQIIVESNHPSPSVTPSELNIPVPVQAQVQSSGLINSGGNNLGGSELNRPSPSRVLPPPSPSPSRPSPNNSSVTPIITPVVSPASSVISSNNGQTGMMPVRLQNSRGARTKASMRKMLLEQTAEPSSSSNPPEPPEIPDEPPPKRARRKAKGTANEDLDSPTTTSTKSTPKRSPKTLPSSSRKSKSPNKPSPKRRNTSNESKPDPTPPPPPPASKKRGRKTKSEELPAPIPPSDPNNVEEEIAKVLLDLKTGKSSPEKSTSESPPKVSAAAAIEPELKPEPKKRQRRSSARSTAPSEEDLALKSPKKTGSKATKKAPTPRAPRGSKGGKKSKTIQPQSLPPELPLTSAAASASALLMPEPEEEFPVIHIPETSPGTLIFLEDSGPGLTLSSALDLIDANLALEPPLNSTPFPPPPPPPPAPAAPVLPKTPAVPVLPKAPATKSRRKSSSGGGGRKAKAPAAEAKPKKERKSRKKKEQVPPKPEPSPEELPDLEPLDFPTIVPTVPVKAKAVKGKREKKVSEPKKTPEPREKKTPEAREKKIPEPRKKTPEPREKKTPEPREKKTPEPKEKKTPELKDKKMAEPKPKKSRAKKKNQSDNIQAVTQEEPSAPIEFPVLSISEDTGKATVVMPTPEPTTTPKAKGKRGSNAAKTNRKSAASTISTTPPATTPATPAPKAPRKSKKSKLDQSKSLQDLSASTESLLSGSYESQLVIDQSDSAPPESGKKKRKRKESSEKRPRNSRKKKPKLDQITPEIEDKSIGNSSLEQQQQQVDDIEKAPAGASTSEPAAAFNDLEAAGVSTGETTETEIISSPEKVTTKTKGSKKVKDAVLVVKAGKKPRARKTPARPKAKGKVTIESPELTQPLPSKSATTPEVKPEKSTRTLSPEKVTKSLENPPEKPPRKLSKKAEALLVRKAKLAAAVAAEAEEPLAQISSTPRPRKKRPKKSVEIPTESPVQLEKLAEIPLVETPVEPIVITPKRKSGKKSDKKATTKSPRGSRRSSVKSEESSQVIIPADFEKQEQVEPEAINIPSTMTKATSKTAKAPSVAKAPSTTRTPSATPHRSSTTGHRRRSSKYDRATLDLLENETINQVSTASEIPLPSLEFYYQFEYTQRNNYPPSMPAPGKRKHAQLEARKSELLSELSQLTSPEELPEQQPSVAQAENQKTPDPKITMDTKKRRKSSSPAAAVEKVTARRESQEKKKAAAALLQEEKKKESKSVDRKEAKSADRKEAKSFDRKEAKSSDRKEPKFFDKKEPKYLQDFQKDSSSRIIVEKNKELEELGGGTAGESGTGEVTTDTTTTGPSSKLVASALDSTESVPVDEGPDSPVSFIPAKAKPIKAPTVFVKSAPLGSSNFRASEMNGEVKKAIKGSKSKKGERQRTSKDAPSLRVERGQVKFFRGDVEEDVEPPATKLRSERPTDSFDSRVPWLCTFCKLGPHVQRLGDLFGPYYVNVARENHEEVSSPPGNVKNEGEKRETWMHQDCALWANELLLIGTSVRGLDKAVYEAEAVDCTICNRKGATIGCLTRKCGQAAHFPCAQKMQWELDDEFFTSNCSLHCKPQSGLLL